MYETQQTGWRETVLALSSVQLDQDGKALSGFLPHFLVFSGQLKRHNGFIHSIKARLITSKTKEEGLIPPKINYERLKTPRAIIHVTVLTMEMKVLVVYIKWKCSSACDKYDKIVK